MMNSMMGATRTMQAVNATCSPAKTAAIMRQYSMESEKMDMAQEYLFNSTYKIISWPNFNNIVFAI